MRQVRAMRVFAMTMDVSGWRFVNRANMLARLVSRSITGRFSARIMRL